MYPAQHMMLESVVLGSIIEFLHNLVVSYNYQGLPVYFPRHHHTLFHTTIAFSSQVFVSIIPSRSSLTAQYGRESF
jgi:hypothetical protein